MVRLNDAQIQLENLVREIDTSGHVLFDADEVKEALRSMEKYLNTVIDEYEKKRRTIDVETGSTQLKDLPALHSFLHSSKDDPALPTGERKFGDEFADNARVVQARIRTYLLQTAEDRLKLAKRLPSQAGISIEPESSGTE